MTLATISRKIKAHTFQNEYWLDMINTFEPLIVRTKYES